MAFGRSIAAMAVALVLGSAAAPVLAQTPEPPIWVVEDEDSTVYMVGTVHMMREGVDWQSPELASIIEGAGAVWLELADFEPPANLGALIMQTGLSPDRPLSSLLTEEELGGLEAILAEHQMPVDSFDALRPWFAYLQISGLMLMEAGFDPAGGIDVHIKGRAEELGIPVNGFETFGEQFETLSGMPEEAQLEVLRETITDYDEAKEDLVVQLESWIGGDLSVLEAETEEIAREMEAFYEALFVERNEGFVDGIEEILAEQGTALVAVGLAHYVGPDSIPALLEARGYTVERR